MTGQSAEYVAKLEAFIRAVIRDADGDDVSDYMNLKYARDDLLEALERHTDSGECG